MQMLRLVETSYYGIIEHLVDSSNRITAVINLSFQLAQHIEQQTLLPSQDIWIDLLHIIHHLATLKLC